LLGAGSYWTLLSARVYGGHLEEAKLIYAEAKARKVDTPSMRGLLFLVAFLQHDGHAMEQQLVMARDAKDTGNAFFGKAETEAYYGRFSQIDPWLRQAAHSGQDSANGSYPRLWAISMALARTEGGKKVEAERTLRKLLPGTQDSNYKLTLAMALSRIGDGKQAADLAEAVDKRFPEDTIVQKFALPTIRASIKLNEKNPEGAIQILHAVEKYEMLNTYTFDNLYPAYIRGLAYLQLGQGRQAAAEFQKLIDHPASVKINVIGALAHLQLGRAEIMMGDRAAARKAYQEFLVLWEKADPDIPIYQQAKAEYATLQ
jgi:tetratricopeptide (TPR) repeat protein